MPKTVSASEAKTKFGSIIDWSLTNGDDVIVESHGKPTVVIIPFEQYQKVRDLREQSRRREALAQMEGLRQQVRARNQDLDEKHAEALADRFTRDVIAGMIEDEKVTFQD